MQKIELYQPSNSDQGHAFMSDHCYECVKYPHDDNAKNQCNIFLRTMAFSVTDKQYPKEWRYVDGEPTCTAFKSREEYNRERREKRKYGGACKPDTQTLSLF